MLLELRRQQLQLRSREQVLDMSVLDDSTIAAGMAATKWAGRLEWLQLAGAGRVLLDGAHNPHAAEALGGYVDSALRPHGGPISWVVTLALPRCRLRCQFYGLHIGQTYAAVHAL
eukprot:s501_g19.t1